MTGNGKSAAAPQNSRRTCKQMLRKHKPHLQKAALVPSVRFHRPEEHGLQSTDSRRMHPQRFELSGNVGSGLYALIRARRRESRLRALTHRFCGLYQCLSWFVCHGFWAARLVTMRAIG